MYYVFCTVLTINMDYVLDETTAALNLEAACFTKTSESTY